MLNKGRYWNGMSMIWMFIFMISIVQVYGDRPTRRFRGPRFLHEPPEIVEFSNSTGTVITCTAQGVPDPAMRWERKDGSTVTTIPGIRQVRPDNSLVFFPIDTSKYRQDVHAATYRCTATNRVGKIRSRDVMVRTGK
ncbi:Down syndrome cell adhesion molecule-like protein Dscam2 [Stegodyphus dumicola]|uniref:Down syndrome cell adhesion molecule-like protein Dscam2 n=1 Tax=Stegodyphus dumicola TaxID=202533 RepID=UPI0015AF6744|nr:Down syndrome cell adhesion molecule-like protein Dscam2 [Stegodyphus dumicola]